MAKQGAMDDLRAAVVRLRDIADGAYDDAIHRSLRCDTQPPVEARLWNARRKAFQEVIDLIDEPTKGATVAEEHR